MWKDNKAIIRLSKSILEFMDIFSKYFPQCRNYAFGGGSIVKQQFQVILISIFFLYLKRIVFNLSQEEKC